MNRVAIREAGMLTQCYDHRELHAVTPYDPDRFLELVEAASQAGLGATLHAPASTVHMRVPDRHGVVTTAGDVLAEEFPLLILACEGEGRRR